jgi:tRNA G18 (ribose-2'-O)-methylase SpoU
MRKLSLDEIETSRHPPDAIEDLPKHPVVTLLDNLRSIHNVGAIFRTSDAARIRHLYLTGVTGTPEHEDLHKTALGAQDTVAWSHHDDALPLLQRLRDDGYTIAALELTDEPSDPSQVSPEVFPLCLVVGNEVFGVNESIIERADLALEIPQYGSKHSLNVSVAYGIAVFDLVRRYRALSGSPEEASPQGAPS